MDVISAIILGIIQGLTEFLPVSSSGHLEIAKKILGAEKVENTSMLMTVVLHFATALSTIIIFKNEIGELFKGLLKFKDNDSFRFSLKILLSMIPASFVGLFFNSEIESFFGGELAFVGAMLIVTAILLLLADKSKPSLKNVRTKDAILIGIAQAVAILPGISRSGATIATSVLLGVDKEKSARFSFLMVVPLIFGKMIQDIFSGQISTNNENFLPLLFGFFAALFTGIIACKWMIRLVKHSQLKYFSYYCFVVGTIVIITKLV